MDLAKVFTMFHYELQEQLGVALEDIVVTYEFDGTELSIVFVIGDDIFLDMVIEPSIDTDSSIGYKFDYLIKNHLSKIK